MTLTVRPSADSVDGGWTNELGGTVLFSSIDEASVDDADFIRSEDNPAADVCKIKLETIVASVEEPFDVNYRFKKVGDASIDLIVRLLEGSTVIAEWLESDISASFVNGNQTLTTPEFAAIADFTNLFLEFEASVSGSFLLLGDGASFLLLADGVSKLELGEA